MTPEIDQDFHYLRSPANVSRHWGAPQECEVPIGGKAYLRLHPSVVVPPISSELEARKLATNGNLKPFGGIDSSGFERNIFGAIVYEAPEKGELCNLTQLFLSGEIWGLDARGINATAIRERTQLFGAGPYNYIPSKYIQDHFVVALENYLAFANAHLGLPLPLRVKAGLVEIKDYSIGVSGAAIAGKALHDTVLWEADVKSHGEPAWGILAPFFDRIWENCGISRTAQDQEALAKRFQSEA